MNPEIEKIARSLFPSDFEEVLRQLNELDALVLKNWKESPERIHAAILKVSGPDKSRFESGLKLAYQDWRVFLNGAGLRFGYKFKYGLRPPD
jgi:hypothetical protein